MKNLVRFIIVLLLPLIGSAQEGTTIKVSGFAVHIDPTPTFKSIVSLSGTYSSLPSEIMNLEGMKAKYRKEVEKAGISWESLRENPNDFGYETLRYEKEGTLYEYSTTSIEEMKKFLQVKTFGLQQLRDYAIFTVDATEAEKLSKIALGNATKKATAITNAMGRTLGPIQEIEDLNNRWGEHIETSLYYDTRVGEYKYYINVIFKVD